MTSNSKERINPHKIPDGRIKHNRNSDNDAVIQGRYSSHYCVGSNNNNNISHRATIHSQIISQKLPIKNL